VVRLLHEWLCNRQKLAMCTIVRSHDNETQSFCGAADSKWVCYSHRAMHIPQTDSGSKKSMFPRAEVHTEVSTLIINYCSFHGQKMSISGHCSRLSFHSHSEHCQFQRPSKTLCTQNKLSNYIVYPGKRFLEYVTYTFGKPIRTAHDCRSLRSCKHYGVWFGWIQHALAVGWSKVAWVEIFVAVSR
jgi:hypothetical protein